MSGKHSRFRLEPAIIDAIDSVRGKEGREAFIRYAVLALLVRYGIRIVPSATRPCSVCGDLFAPVRRNAHICSNRCRLIAFRKRKQQQEQAA
jgi:predicted nucleic acid-binding Zn ribbon protein